MIESSQFKICKRKLSIKHWNRRIFLLCSSCVLLSFCLFIGSHFCLFLNCIVIQGSAAQYHLWSNFQCTPTTALLFSKHSYLNRLGLFPKAMHTSSSALVALLYILDIQTFGSFSLQRASVIMFCGTHSQQSLLQWVFM